VVSEEQSGRPQGGARRLDHPVGQDPTPLKTGAVLLAILLALCVVVALVWGLGGFKRRTDLLTITAPGAKISTGPFEFTFTEVTAQQKTGFDDAVSWQLTAIGAGRTTGNESIAPRYTGNGMFVSKDTRSGEVQEPDGLRWGAAQSFTEGAEFTPGLPPIEFRVQFKYSERYVPADPFRFVVFQLEYRDASLLGGQDKQWRNSNHCYEYRLPVRVLPADG